MDFKELTEDCGYFSKEEINIQFNIFFENLELFSKNFEQKKKNYPTLCLFLMT